MGILSNLISWGTLIGFVLGFLTSRAWQLVKVCRLDKRRPLPDGRHRSKWEAIAVDPRYAAGAMGVVFLVWSVVQTQANADRTESIASEAAATSQRTNECFGRLIEAIVDSRRVTAQIDQISTANDRLSQEERALLADLLRYQAEWLGRILDPPAEVDRLERDDPVREHYVLDVTRGFFNRAGEVNKRIDRIHVEQAENDRARPTPRPAPRPALPDPDCSTK